MAYLSIFLFARLYIYSSRREPIVAPRRVPKSARHDAYRRALARGELDFRFLGCVPRNPFSDLSRVWWCMGSIAEASQASLDVRTRLTGMGPLQVNILPDGMDAAAKDVQS